MRLEPMSPWHRILPISVCLKDQSGKTWATPLHLSEDKKSEKGSAFFAAPFLPHRLDQSSAGPRGVPDRFSPDRSLLTPCVRKQGSDSSVWGKRTPRTPLFGWPQARLRQTPASQKNSRSRLENRHPIKLKDSRLSGASAATR